MISGYTDLFISNGPAKYAIVMRLDESRTRPRNEKSNSFQNEFGDTLGVISQDCS